MGASSLQPGPGLSLHLETAQSRYYIHICVCVYICIYFCLCRYTYTCVYIYSHVYVYIYVYIYVYTYIYTLGREVGSIHILRALGSCLTAKASEARQDRGQRADLQCAGCEAWGGSSTSTLMD